MKKIHFYTRLKSIFLLRVIILLTAFAISFISQAQVIVPFNNRTSVYSPTKTIYNIKGDYTLIGNSNLTLVSYGDNNGNENSMQYIDIDGVSSTLNSSSATLQFSTENGANPECSKIIYAGLYWTGRAHDDAPSADVFSITKGSVTVNFDKHKVLLKGPSASSYTEITASSSNISYPADSIGMMYSAYAEVTDYVKQNGVGAYTVANIALREGRGGGTGYYGGWGLIVIYENSKMKWRDVVLFDGHAYVQGNTTINYTLPISGFHTVQNGQVNMKLGIMAGEGDRTISGDYFNIQKHSSTDWVALSHAGNSTNNFFNSSIYTGGNPRNPTILNNTGMDISMFNVPNPSNSIIKNNQTSVNFQYGSTQDTYIIFMMAMAVDAYIPEPESQNILTSINNIPYIQGNPVIAQPGEEIEVKVDIRNKGTEAIDSSVIYIPIPFASSYVNSSKQIFFSPLPSPNQLIFNPTLGANGTLIWNIGTLPLPANPNDLLATLTYRIKVTDDCIILSNPHCTPEVNIFGYMSGTGQVSHTHVGNVESIQGYLASGNCFGEPIPDPIKVTINYADYVASHCQNTVLVRNFTYCNLTSPIPITQISGNFLPGSRFYNEYPTTPSTIEYTISNPFPATAGTATYYAVPAGTTDCYFVFTITNSEIYSTPTVSPVNYCLGATAVPLTAIPSDTSYKLYYYTSTSPSEIPQLSITPSTSAIGTTTYYVAEGISGTCISPNRAPITVTVRPLPVVSATTNSPICIGSNLYLHAISDTTLTWSWSGPNGFTSALQNPSIIGANSLNNGLYTVTVSDGYCQNTASTTAYINNAPIVVTNCPSDITVCADTVFSGILGSFVDWEIPDFTRNCLDSALGSNNNFVMRFELPEVKWACWQFNRVQRIGTNSGFVNLWQSTGSGNPSILSPSVYIEPAVDVTMDLVCPAGRDYTWSLYLVKGTTETLIGSKYITATGHYMITIPASIAADIYRLKFVFSGNGDNKCAVDNIYFDAILMDKGSCVEGIEFNTTGPIPGFFPVGDSSLTYTATYTLVSGTTITSTCNFVVNVEGVTAHVSASQNATCNKNNGSITISAQSSASTHNFEYLIQGGMWIPFGSGNTQVTIPNLAPNSYNIRVRDLALSGDCETVTPILFTLGVTTDTIPPYLTTNPGNLTLYGCNTDVIPTLPYSETLVAISEAQFNSIGAYASDNCEIVSYSYIDTKIVNCSTTVNRKFTFTDQAGNSQTFIQTITILDNVAPAVPANGNLTVECISAAIVPVTPVVVDDCGSTITPVLFSTIDTPSSITCEGTRVYTYKYADCAGNSSDWTFTYTIEREPFANPADAGSTVSCVALAVAPTLPLVKDNCGNTLIPTGPTISQAPACEGIMTYTYVYTDCEGNSQDWVYTYTIEREPFANPADAGSTVSCVALAVAPTLPVVKDNCGNTLIPTGPTISEAPTCEGIMTYTYVYTDCEGNSQDWVYTYTIEREPFANPVDAGSTVSCVALAVAPALPVVKDNCGNTLIPTGPTISTAPACEGIMTYTYVYTDCEGNSQDWVYTYTIEREPFANPVDAGSTVSCVALAVAPALPVVKDNCGNTLTPTSPTISEAPACEGIMTYTYVYTDCEGNSQDWVYTYTIEREPFANPADAGSTVSCIALAVAPTLPVVKDNCGNTLTPTGPTISTAPACEGIITYTYVYTDCEGNSQDWVYTYTIEREPFENPADAGSTVSCVALAVAPALPVVKDNCGNTLIPTGPTISEAPACEGIMTYTYVYTDCEGNSQDWVYTYTIEREPFANPADAGSTVSCVALAVAPVLPVVKDNCGNTLIPTSPTISEAPACEGIMTYTYVYTDCEGNSQDWVYTYTIEREPFANPADAGSTVSCVALAVAPTLPVVKDNCGNTLIPTGPTISTAPACEGIMTYTYVYTDCEGNSQDWVYTYTIERNDFVMPSNGGSSVTCISQMTQPVPPSVSDHCGNSITPSGPSVTSNPVCSGTKVYTWTYTDCEGNTHDWSYTYTLNDNIAPNLIGTIPVGQTNMNLCFANIPVGPSASEIMALYADNCGGSVIATKSGTPTGNSCSWSVTYTYEVKDACGNITVPSPTVTYSGGDKTNPVIVCPTVPASVWPNSGPNYTQTGTSWDATATDNCSTPAVTFTLSGATTTPNNLSTLNGVTFNYGTTIVTWTAKDSCGNSSSCSYSINVTDNTPPSISCPPALSATCSNLVPAAYGSLSEFIAAGGYVNDISGINESSFILLSQISDGNSCPETITRYYQVADIIGNTATCSQIIIVNDTIDPTFTRPADITLYKDANCDFDASPLIAGNATNVSDNCDTNPIVSYTDKSCFGSIANAQMNHGNGYYFPVTITGFDGLSAGNIGKVELNFTSNQGKGNAEFILISPSGDAIMLVGPYCSGGYCDAQASNNYNPTFYPASSSYPKWINSNNIPNGAGQFSPNGGASVENTFGEITGFNGNWRTKFEDLQGPMNGQWMLFGRKFTTSVGTIEFNGICITPKECPDDDFIVRNWTVTDHCGNVSNAQAQLIMIKDTTAPTFTRPADITIYTDANCGYNANVSATGDVTNEADNCSTGIQATYSDVVANGTCAGSHIITRTWALVDHCGNAAANQIQTITVKDNIVPSLTMPANVTVNNNPTLCGANVTVPIPVTSDNCSSVTLVNSINGTGNASGYYPVGTTTISWTATDACGNSTSGSMTVTVVDNEAPVINCPANVSNCSPTFILGTPDVTDNCGILSVSNNAPSTFPIGVPTIVIWTATDIHGNSSSCEQTVTISNMSASISGSSQVSCHNDSDGKIIVTVNGGTPPYSYILNGGTPQASNIFDNLPSNTYRVVVRDANGCSVSTNAIEIGNPETMIASIIGTSQVSCHNASDGSITIVADGGTGAYTYVLNGGTPQSGNTYSNLAVGTYTVVVYDINGCSVTSSPFIISNPPLLVASATGSSQVSCHNASDGTITVTATGGTGALSYSLNGGAPQSGNIFNGLAAGTYTVVVTDVNNCSATTEAVIINNPPQLVASAIGSSQVSCHNASDGMVTVTATGGTGALSYSLNGGNPQASNVFSGLAAGSYTVVVTDANSCSAITETVSISNPPQLTATIDGSSQVACNNSPDGMITVTASGGTGALSYSLNGGTPQAGNTFNGLAAGTYVMVVRDINGCSFTTVPFSINNPALLVASATGSSQVSCHNASDGMITVTATGGTGVLSYSLNGGTPQAGNVFNGLSSGNYSVVVSDINGCSFTTNTVVIINPPLLVASAEGSLQVSCHNASDGIVTVTASGGTGTLSYSLNGGTPQASNVFSGLASGTYTVVVTDANGCSAITEAVTISNPPQLVATAEGSSQVSCHNASDGIITVTATGGTGVYTYRLNGGTPQANNVFSGLLAGSYTVVVTDANGCSAITEAVIINNPPQLVASAEGSSQVSCHNASDGIITVTATGGTGALSYSLNGGTPQASNAFRGLTAGSYTVVVSDANGCSAITEALIINNPPQLVASAEGSSQVSCHNASDGIITVTATGGTGALSYSLNGGTPQASNAFSGLAAGSYTVVVTDANGCSAITEAVIINNPPQLVATAVGSSQVSCNNANDGVITVTAMGGTGAYKYSLNGGAPQESNVFSGLVAGTYTVVVTDVNGCSTITEAVIINNPAFLVITVEGSSQVSCHNASDGIITASASGGTGSYRFSLNGGDPQESNVFSGLTAGSYIISVVDENGCSARAEAIIINNPALLVAYAEGSSQVSCNNASDAHITVNASGGTGSFTYSLNGGNPQSSNVFENLVAGSYTITVTDANGCIAVTEAIIIENPTLLTLTATGSEFVTCHNGNDGVINLRAFGGTGNYRYALNDGPYQASGTFTNLSAGSYVGKVIDVNQCTAETIKSIYNPSEIVATAIGRSHVSCSGSTDGSFTVLAEGGIGNYQYSVNGGDYQSSNVFENLAPGEYNITVIDGQSCMGKATFVISPQEPILTSLTTTNAECHGFSGGSAEVAASGGTAPYNYQWSNGASGAIVTDLPGGSYTVTITDAYDCKMTQRVTIGYNQRIEIEPVNVFTPNEDGINDTWTIKNIELYPDNDLVIINRWGNEVYTQKSYKNEWNGSQLNEGTYFYVLKVNMCNEERKYSGFITIIK